MSPPPLTYGTYSYAPTSQAASRATPRWSVAGQTAVLAAPMAGLPPSSACVRVGPPLSANPVNTRADHHLVTAHRCARAIGEDIVAQRSQRHCASPQVARQAAKVCIIRHDAVLQLKRSCRRAKRAYKEAARRAARGIVVNNGAVQDSHGAICDEHRAAVPGRGGVATDRAVDDSGIAQRTQTTGHIARHIAAHRTIGDVNGAVEEAIDAATGLAQRAVIANGAVSQIERGAVAIVDAAAA